ncbi:MAG: VOC family protein [Actinomycetota bacterium]
MSMQLTPGPIEHIALTVSDLDKSVDWYSTLFGEPPMFVGVMREGTAHEHRAAVWATPNLGLHCFDERTDGGFNAHRPGLDHVAFSCSGIEELREWASRLDDMGAERGDVVAETYGSALGFVDPDGIALEFYASFL